MKNHEALTLTAGHLQLQLQEKSTQGSANFR
jgi:hypothetical protein